MHESATGRGRCVARLALASGGGLAFSAAAAGLLLWIVVVPWLRGSSAPEFSPERSRVGLWEDGRRLLRWGLWTHDDGFRVGYFGNEEWVPSLVSSMVSGAGISCAGGHREVALEFITNHSPPRGADLGEFWSNWWEEHGGEPQTERIRRGFLRDGLDLAVPAEEGDWPGLLEALGAKRVESGEGESEGDGVGHAYWEDTEFEHPDRARYNAFRWLRDSGFDPVAYALEFSETLDPAAREGLSAYRKFENELRSAVPGRLDFAPVDDWGWGMPLSARQAILEPGMQQRFGAVLAVAFAMGCAGAQWGWRHLRRGDGCGNRPDRGQYDGPIEAAREEPPGERR